MGRGSRKAQLIAAIGMAVIVFGGCTGGENAGSSNGGGGVGARLQLTDGGDPDPGPADVSIVNFRFDEDEFTTSVGSAVQWVNEGTATHTVTSDDFDSGSIRSGRGFAHQFDEAGEYEYWCKNHPGMEGTIIVE